jgi:hypothetical protein
VTGARQLNFDHLPRNTVKAALASDGPPRYVRAPAGSVADGFEPRVRELLAAFPSMPSTVIAERVGWPYSLRTLSGKVAEWRPAYEEILAILREVPVLVDKLEARHSGFFEDVLDSLKQAEQTLTNIRLPAASQIAVYRARLIEAGRGVQQGDLTIVGRPSVSKIKKATAALLLGRSNDVLQALIAGQQPVALSH